MFADSGSPIEMSIHTRLRAGKVCMWDLVTKKLLAQVAAHTGVITSLAVIEKDGTMMLLSAGADKSIKVWEPQGG